MPVFIAKYNESLGTFGQEAPELIGTIKVPRNLSLLSDRLPASQYETDEKLKQIDLKGLQVIQEDNENEYRPVVGIASRQSISKDASKEPFEDIVSMSKQLGAINERQR